MTELGDYVRRLIQADGPISVATYMSLALGHPDHGYYMCRDPLGASGDFTTAPEVSQIFGELIGLWCVQCWMDMGGPGHFELVELGPGRGTLMADALRAAAIRPDFLAAAQIHLVETSPILREKQRRMLAGHDVKWHARLEDLPCGPPVKPGLYIANEFFDALPVRQFERSEHGWHERMIGIDPATEALCFLLSPVAVQAPPLQVGDIASAPAGSVVEVSPVTQAVTSRLANRIAERGGAALIVDYGTSKTAPGDSFQAVRRHGFADPLAEPGLADLTAHVDFETMAKTAVQAGIRVYGPTTQGAFLDRLGIAHRAETLARGVNAQTRSEIAGAVDRLTAPEQMGSLFKVMALCHPRANIPAGFTLSGADS